jgi:hypothetical protein
MSLHAPHKIGFVVHGVHELISKPVGEIRSFKRLREMLR